MDFVSSKWICVSSQITQMDFLQVLRQNAEVCLLWNFGEFENSCLNLCKRMVFAILEVVLGWEDLFYLGTTSSHDNLEINCLSCSTLVFSYGSIWAPSSCLVGFGGHLSVIDYWSVGGIGFIKSTSLHFFQWKKSSRSMRHLKRSGQCCFENVPNTQEIEEQKPAACPAVCDKGLVPQHHLPRGVKGPWQQREVIWFPSDRQCAFKQVKKTGFCVHCTATPVCVSIFV